MNSATTELARTLMRTTDSMMAREIDARGVSHIFSAMEGKMRDLGIKWTDVHAEVDRLRAEHQTAPGVTFRRPGATSPTTPLQGSAKGRTHG